MRCENCGRDLPEDAAFCPDCGQRTPARSAAEIVELAHTAGLVRGRESGQVPDVPEIPGIPDAVPELPETAPLPDAPGMEIPGGEAATANITTGFLDRARLREERRRAAQALVESAQTELREELAEIAERESMIAARGYDLEEVYPTQKPPPPPPPSSLEESIWADTEERAKLHGVEMPWGADEEAQSRQQDNRRLGEKLQAAAEKDGSKCCTFSCVALIVAAFALFVLGFILITIQ